jgi:hypothetical protein
MLAVYARLGVTAVGRVQRLARLVRIDAKLTDVLRSAAVGRALAAPANAVLRLRYGRRSDADGMVAGRHAGACGDEFTALARQASGRRGACVQRSGEYLTWRYLANPLAPCEMLTLRAAGALRGYAVVTVDGNHATLLDLFGIDTEVEALLLARVVSLADDRRASTVSAPVLASHPSLPVLERLGFVAREDQPFVAYGRDVPVSAAGGTGWRLWYGDRDS